MPAVSFKLFQPPGFRWNLHGFSFPPRNIIQKIDTDNEKIQSQHSAIWCRCSVCSWIISNASELWWGITPGFVKDLKSSLNCWGNSRKLCFKHSFHLFFGFIRQRRTLVDMKPCEEDSFLWVAHSLELCNGIVGRQSVEMDTGFGIFSFLYAWKLSSFALSHWNEANSRLRKTALADFLPNRVLWPRPLLHHLCLRARQARTQLINAVYYSSQVINSRKWSLGGTSQLAAQATAGGELIFSRHRRTISHWRQYILKYIFSYTIKEVRMRMMPFFILDNACFQNASCRL